MRRIILTLSAFLVACGSTPNGDDGKQAAAGRDAAIEASAPAPAQASAYATPGFAVHPDGDRLWVFRDGSEGHRSCLAHGEPAERVTLIGAGPEGETIYGAEIEMLRACVDGFQQQ